MKKQQYKQLHTDFYIRRIHSFLGLIPIGIFLCLHLILNSSAIIGGEAWASVINGMRGVPFIFLAEIGIIAIPLIFHVIYGFYIVYLSGYHGFRYQYLSNLMYILQRVTAVITTIFVIDHVVFVRILPGSTVGVMEAMIHVLQTPFGMILEIIGVCSAVFHFCNGLFTFLITWGVLQGERLQKLVWVLTMMLCAVLCLLAIIILVRISMIQV